MTAPKAKTVHGEDGSFARRLLVFPCAVLFLILSLLLLTLLDLWRARASPEGPEEDVSASEEKPGVEGFLEWAQAETADPAADLELIRRTPDLGAVPSACRLWLRGERDAVVRALWSPLATPGFQTQLLLLLGGASEAGAREVAAELLEREGTDRRVRRLCETILAKGRADREEGR